MQQWEYLKLGVYAPIDIDEYGKQGWELVAVSDGWLFFKRPKHIT